MDLVGVKVLRANTLILLRGVLRLLNRLLLHREEEDRDPKGVEVMVVHHKVDVAAAMVVVVGRVMVVGGAVAMGCHNSSMAALLSIKVGGGEALLSKEGAVDIVVAAEDMVVAEAGEVVVWAVAVA